MPSENFIKDKQYYKFCLYGFFKNLRFFEAFLILFFLDNGLNFLQIGLLYSIREIIVIIMEIPSGFIADALGRRKTMISSFLIYALSFLGFGFSSNFFFFSISMILFAVADAFRTGVHKAMIFHYLKRNDWQMHKVEYYGKTRSWSQAGSAVSALIAALLVFISGNYQIIFLAAIIPYLLDAILVWSYPKYLDGERKQIRTSIISYKFKEVWISFKLSFTNLSIFRSLANLSLYTGYYKSVKDYIQELIKLLALATPIMAWLTEEKKTAVFIGVFYFVTYFLTSVSSSYSGKFYKLFKNAVKPMNLSIIIGLSMGLFIGVFYEYGIFALAIIGFVLLMIIENLRKPIGIALIAEQSKDKAMATILSVESQAKSLFAAILAPIIGLLADEFSLGISLFIVSLTLILLSKLYLLKKSV